MIYLFTVGFIILVVLYRLRYQADQREKDRSNQWIHQRISDLENHSKDNYSSLKVRIYAVEQLVLAKKRPRGATSPKTGRATKTFGEFKGVVIDTSKGIAKSPDKWLSTKRAAQLKKKRDAMRAYRAKKKVSKTK